MTNARIAHFIATCNFYVYADAYEVVGEHAIYMRLDRDTMAVKNSNLKSSHPAYDAMIDFAVFREQMLHKSA